MRLVFNPIQTEFCQTRRSDIPIPAPPAVPYPGDTLDMGTANEGSPGTPDTFSVEGTSLLGDIIVTSFSSDIEVSLSVGSGYASSVSVSPSGGTVAATTIYVRTKSTASVGSVSGNVHVSSMGAQGYPLACTGTVQVPSGPSFPSTGLVAAWSFDDTLTDSVGSKVLTPTGGNSYVTGKLGTKALQLTAGNSASVTTDAFDFQANPMSMACWVQFATGGSAQVGTDNGGACYFMSLFGTEADFAGDSQGSITSPFLVADTATFADDTWHLVVFRFDGANVYGNVNARTEVSTAGDNLGSATGGDFRITASTATCKFDALYIWSRCLTDQEVSDLYNSGSGLTP